MFLKGINGEQGEVLRVHGKSASVKIQAHESCDRCKLCNRISSSEMVVEAFMSDPVKEGDKVVISVRPGTVVSSAVILYILPLIGLVFGYYLARCINSFLGLGLKGELFPALFSIAVLFLCFIPIRLYDRKKSKDGKFRIYIHK